MSALCQMLPSQYPAVICLSCADSRFGRARIAYLKRAGCPRYPLPRVPKLFFAIRAHKYERRLPLGTETHVCFAPFATEGSTSALCQQKTDRPRARYRHLPRLLMSPRTRRRIIAPIVADTIEAAMPVPTRMPNLGSSQLEISAPITPIPMFPTRPNPQPVMMTPASQPAANPTSKMTSRLSPDMEASPANR